MRLPNILLLLVGLLGIYSESLAAQKDILNNGITALGFDAANNTLLKAAAKTLYRSEDEGRTWTPVALPPAALGRTIAALATSAKSKNIWYVAGRGFGVLRSADGGRSWTARNKGLPSREVTALTTHADQADTVYAYVVGQGIFRSQDAGAHWRLMDRGPRTEIRQFVHSNMPGSMQTGWLFAATSKGLGRSMDCFCGWHDAGALATEVHAVSYDPRGPKRIYAATQRGLIVSTDGGETWASMNSPAKVITALVATSSGTLFIAGENGLFRSHDQGATWGKVGG